MSKRPRIKQADGSLLDLPLDAETLQGKGLSELALKTDLNLKQDVAVINTSPTTKVKDIYNGIAEKLGSATNGIILLKTTGYTSTFGLIKFSYIGSNVKHPCEYTNLQTLKKKSYTIEDTTTVNWSTFLNETSYPSTVEYATLGEVTDAIDNFNADVFEPAINSLRDDIPTKTSELENDSNFLSEIPSNVVTKNEQGAIKLEDEYGSVVISPSYIDMNYGGSNVYIGAEDGAMFDGVSATYIESESMYLYDTLEVDRLYLYNNLYAEDSTIYAWSIESTIYEDSIGNRIEFDNLISGIHLVSKSSSLALASSDMFGDDCIHELTFPNTAEKDYSSYQWDLPAKSGTLALTSDIPSRVSVNAPVRSYIDYIGEENANSQFQVAFRYNGQENGLCWSRFANISTTSSNPSECTYNGFFYVVSYENSLSGANANPFIQYHGDAPDFRILTTAYSDQWLQQIATDFRTPYIYVRRRENGSWSNWVRLLDTTGGTLYKTTYSISDPVLYVLQDGAIGSGQGNTAVANFTAYSESPYGLQIQISPAGDTTLQSRRIGNNTEKFPLQLNPEGGAVYANGKLVSTIDSIPFSYTFVLTNDSVPHYISTAGVKQLYFTMMTNDNDEDTLYFRTSNTNIMGMPLKSNQLIDVIIDVAGGNYSMRNITTGSYSGGSYSNDGNIGLFVSSTSGSSTTIFAVRGYRS